MMSNGINRNVRGLTLAALCGMTLFVVPMANAQQSTDRVDFGAWLTLQED